MEFDQKDKMQRMWLVLFDFDRFSIDILWYSRLRHRLVGEFPTCSHKPHDFSKYVCRMLLKVKSSSPVIAK